MSVAQRQCDASVILKETYVYDLSVPGRKFSQSILNVAREIRDVHEPEKRTEDMWIRINIKQIDDL